MILTTFNLLMPMTFCFRIRLAQHFLGPMFIKLMKVENHGTTHGCPAACHGAMSNGLGSAMHLDPDMSSYLIPLSRLGTHDVVVGFGAAEGQHPPTCTNFLAGSIINCEGCQQPPLTSGSLLHIKADLGLLGSACSGLTRRRVHLTGDMSVEMSVTILSTPANVAHQGRTLEHQRRPLQPCAGPGGSLGELLLWSLSRWRKLLVCPSASRC